MEDSKNVPPPPKDSSSRADRVIELTPEMEVISANRGKIIDLTQVLFSPGTPAPAAKPAAPATPKPIVARTTSPLSAKISPFSAKISRQKGIESDLDAAFDYIQSKAEELRGPRVEPKPSEDGLKVSVPSPIGDWDDTIVDTAPMPAGNEAVPEETPAPEALQEAQENPAEPTASPVAADLPQAISGVEAEIPALEEAKADAVSPTDLPPLEEIPATHAAADAPAPAPPAPATMEILDEEPASLLENAIEIDENEDEEIIELTDIVSAEELAAAQEDEIIELTEIVSAEELAAAGYPAPAATAPQAEQAQEEEEIIELTEIVSGEELAAAGYPAPAATAPQAEQAQEEEEIIELVDRVELPLPEDTAAMAAELVRNPPESQPESEPEAPAPAALEDKDTEEMTLEVFAEKQAPPEAIKPETDQVIRLDSVLSHARKHQERERISEEITLGAEEALAKEPVSTGEKFPIGIAMEEVKEALGPQAALTEAEIEAVIEKIIRTKYGQTIEQMIATVVEKVVTREMNDIKRNLMEDQGESDEL